MKNTLMTAVLRFKFIHELLNTKGKDTVCVYRNRETHDVPNQKDKEYLFEIWCYLTNNGKWMEYFSYEHNYSNEIVLKDEMHHLEMRVTRESRALRGLSVIINKVNKKTRFPSIEMYVEPKHFNKDKINFKKSYLNLFY